MTTFDIMLDGKTRKVELKKQTETSFSASTNSKQMNVKLPSAEFDIGAPFTVEVEGKTYRVDISSVQRDTPVMIKVEDVVFKAELKSYSAIRVSDFMTIKTTASSPQKRIPILKQVPVEGAVVASMTGKVVSIKVKKGYHVKANQVLCIIEAMKMENEIVSSIDGKVQEINVTEGSPVNEGEVLLIIA